VRKGISLRIGNCPLLCTKLMKKIVSGTYHSVIDTNNNIVAVRCKDSAVTALSIEFVVHPIGNVP
jgi:hypothetical protein